MTKRSRRKSRRYPGKKHSPVSAPYKRKHHRSKRPLKIQRRRRTQPAINLAADRVVPRRKARPYSGFSVGKRLARSRPRTAEKQLKPPRRLSGTAIARERDKRVAPKMHPLDSPRAHCKEKPSNESRRTSGQSRAFIPWCDANKGSHMKRASRR